MKAIRLHARGGAEQLVYEEAPRPALRPGDALVRVLASGLTRNELDWGPTYTDEQGNSRLPSIPGHELCGVVETVAQGVTEVAPGDVAYGLTSFFRDGTAAEYVAVNAADLAPRPRVMSAVEAATVPLAGLTAWQALFDHGDVAAGQRVLVHGAAGGVGNFAIQLAKWRGAQVIGVTSAANISFVKDLGAQEAIDYAASPFETATKPVDMILDTIGGEIQRRSWSLLKPGGVLVSIAGEGIEVPSDVRDRRGLFFIVKADRQELIKIGQLIDDGRVKTVIAAVVSLERAREAFGQLLQPEKRGKVVVSVAENFLSGQA
jgi:NADPH:quinone reductase-like Zn-dependent oxidoreductase